jgi:hypothetical protein
MFLLLEQSPKGCLACTSDVVLDSIAYRFVNSCRSPAFAGSLSLARPGNFSRARSGSSFARPGSLSGARSGGLSDARSGGLSGAQSGAGTRGLA